jgi:hypothetical protein
MHIGKSNASQHFTCSYKNHCEQKQTRYGFHLRLRCMEEEVGFEPTDPFEPLVFKTRAIDHSTTLPCLVPLERFELSVLLLLRETALPICPQGSGAAGGTRTHTIRILNPARMPIPSLPLDGAPGESRTPKIQFLRLTCIPVPSPGHVGAD